MGLAEYRRKRDFRKTREPRGKKAKSTRRSFVIQKHDASHLHYDFRLELDGVLKSWAVPKGPSLDPSEKRLAVQVEDHPLEYGQFEGTIPKGEYGGGTVLLWDEGDWEPLGDPHKDFRSGKLKFQLRGKKLRGGWMLVRSGGRAQDPRNWLLFKERDDEARPREEYDITAEEPLSVASNRDLNQIAEGGDRVWSSSRGRNGQTRRSASAVKKPVGRAGSAKRKKRSAVPSNFGPQLATLVNSAPMGDEWLHEIKFDGYRILAYVNGEDVRLRSRNHLDWTGKFASIAAKLGELGRDVILDGEVVVLDEKGRSDFQALQNALREQRAGKLVYYVFDLLWIDDDDVRSQPLSERRKALAALRLPTARGVVRISEHVVGGGPEFFAEAERLGLEGTISKRPDRPYRSGRTTDWLKVKCAQTAEFVIAGYTPPTGSRQGFGALLLGYYEKPEEFRYAGRVGTGFDDKLLNSLFNRLYAMRTDHSPFGAKDSLGKRGAIWVRPELVAQVRFSNWTRDGLLRHPAFLGLREDKAAQSVGREVARPLAGVVANEKASRAKKAAPRRGNEETSIAGQRMTHPDKVLYPDDGITKRQLAEYFLSVADWMLPEVRDRPISIVRCPDGLGGQRFFQKHPGAGMLNDMKRVRIREKEKQEDYVVIRDAGDLVALAQVGTLEIHAWGSRADQVERPDRLVFDLDPAPDVPWKEVVVAVRRICDFLRELGLQSFAKTSGGKGLHLVVPIVRRHDWPIVARFCRGVAISIVQADPKRFIATMSKAACAGKIFVDYLRNQRGATSVAAYSTRAQTGVPLSMPVSWKELPALKSASEFRLDNISQRIATLKRSDPWDGIDELRQSLTQKMIALVER